MTVWAERFLAVWCGGDKGSEEERAALEIVLLRCIAEARAALPGIALSDEDLVDALGRRAVANKPAAIAVAAIAAADVALADACARDIPGALAVFEARFLTRLPAWIGHLRGPGWLVDEARQKLRERLFVAAPGQPPRIAQYAGQGPLEGWTRVAAVRVALNLLDERQPERRLADLDDASALMRPGQSLELDYLKARYREPFAAAFRDALAALPSRDRNLLRFHYMEQLTPARVGALYGVHRTTVGRWIDEAREAVLLGTRDRLIERLRLSEAECDSLIGLVYSRLGVTLGSLLQANP